MIVIEAHAVIQDTQSLVLVCILEISSIKEAKNNIEEFL